MNPDNIPQEVYEQIEVQAQSYGFRLQTLIGLCMSLEADLMRAERAMGTNIAQVLKCRQGGSLILAARECLVEAGKELEIPLEVKDAATIHINPNPKREDFSMVDWDEEVKDG